MRGRKHVPLRLPDHTPSLTVCTCVRVNNSSCVAKAQSGDMSVQERKEDRWQGPGVHAMRTHLRLLTHV
jgi:hypothetical protein